MELNGLKIMVTWGAGFIGSYLVDRLIDMDNYFIVYDNSRANPYSQDRS